MVTRQRINGIAKLVSNTGVHIQCSHSVPIHVIVEFDTRACGGRVGWAKYPCNVTFNPWAGSLGVDV